MVDILEELHKYMYVPTKQTTEVHSDEDVEHISIEVLPPYYFGRRSAHSCKSKRCPADKKQLRKWNSMPRRFHPSRRRLTYQIMLSQGILILTGPLNFVCTVTHIYCATSSLILIFPIYRLDKHYSAPSTIELAINY